MAAGGFKEFVAGSTLDEDDINDFLMQGVLVFAGTAARGSAIPSPVEGQFSFRTDDDALEFYDGSDWVELTTPVEPAVVSATTGSPTITSGTVIDGVTYDIYQFTGDGSITFSEPGFADFLVLAGGGGGGRNNNDGAGGGGGAGSIITQGRNVAAGTATVTIGAGGTGATSDGTNGVAGGNSVCGGLRVNGGSGGGGAATVSFGGSGGGGRGDLSAATGGQGLGAFFHLDPGPGNNGGNGFPNALNNNRAGGGGGGTSAVGVNGTGGTGGNGGAGISSDITGASLFYGGGGGGGARVGTPGTGGSSIGGDGDGNGLAGDAASPANRGSGGGGGSRTGNGGSGSSGVVIVRVAV